MIWKLHKFLKPLMKTKPSLKRYLTIAALLGALIVGKVLSRIVDKLLEYMFNYKPMLGIDTLFL